MKAPPIAICRMRVGSHERLAWFRERWDPGEWDRSWWEGFDRPAALRLLDDCRADYVQVEAMRRALPRDRLVLEAGCGLGQWVVILRESGHDVIGTDLSAVSLTKARSFFPEIRLVRADVTRLPFPDGSLGGVVSIGVLEHFPDGPGPGLEEVRRALAPGGVLFSAVPLFNPLRALLVRRSTPPPGLVFYQWGFTAAEFATLLGSHGFTVTATVPFATLKTLRDVLGTSAPLPVPPRGDRRPGRMGRILRTAIKHRLLNVAPIRQAAGHMMAFVATRNDGGVQSHGRREAQERPDRRDASVVR